jgi:hypothetical protein
MCCRRCTPDRSHVCCDICSDATLSVNLLPTQAPSSMRAKRKIKIPEHEMTSGEHRLREKLREWREFQMVEEGLDSDVFFGPQVIMSNKTLDRIVDLAYAFKLPDVTSLCQQTDWCHVNEYGTKIIDIVLACIPTHPTPVLAPSTRQNLSTPSSPQAAAPSKRQNRCRACQGVGHNGECPDYHQLFNLNRHSTARNRLCPMYGTKSRQFNSENIPPAPATILPTSSATLQVLTSSDMFSSSNMRSVYQIFWFYVICLCFVYHTDFPLLH